MEKALAGKRVLITQATAFMGPALCEVFTAQGAEVVASADDLVEADAAERVVRAAGHIDVLVANLAIKAPSTPAVDVTDAEWRDVFAALVDPLPRLVRAAAPAMIARRAGKILLMGSASALRGMKRASTYSAARVLLKPASPGTGVIAGGGVRAVVEAAGIKDILTKSMGSANILNVVKATNVGLRSLKSPEEEAQRRGKPIESIMPFWSRNAQ